ncbi:MAG: hypothetical protein HZA90_04035 [Verrucomicrobia bacterium]|nr:hypothetical protein [Verrucomicrobiota bacterium]
MKTAHLARRPRRGSHLALLVGAFCVTASAQTLILEQVLDTSGLVWTTNGAAGWFGQTNVTHDGVDAARSGTVTHDQESVLETAVTGPGILSFWWKVSSQYDSDWSYDSLDFYLGAQSYMSIVGETGWKSGFISIPAGPQTVKWVYAKDWAGSAGADGGWVDQVAFVPDAPTGTLDVALDAPSWTWTNSGAVSWFGQTNFTHDGADAAQSPSVQSGEEAILQTTVSGPGILSFWWKSDGGLYFYLQDEWLFDAGGLLPPQSDWIQRYAFIPAGPQVVQWIASDGADWVDQVALTPSASTLALDVALDAPGWTWTNNGTRGWFGQTNIAHDGLHAAQCVPATNRGSSTLQTTVTGPGSLSFWWKVSSLGTNELFTHGGDFLEFYVNGVLQERICNEVDWQPQSYTLPEGSVVLQWVYAKDSFFTSGSDAAWVDRVRLITDVSTPPAIVRQPASQTVPDGSTVNFSVDALGSVPLFYQWRFQGAPLANATNAVLTLPNATGAQAGQYSVVVSNAVGVAVSSNALLTVLPPMAEVLDTPGRVWTTTGPNLWFGQTNVTHDGVDAAQSGAVGAGQESILQTTVTGPGVLTFWWKVSSGIYGGMLFYLGNTPRLVITEESDWQFQSVAISSGQQVVQWISDRRVGWVDQVTFTPSGAAAALDVALDTPGWTWETSSQAPWFGQTLTTHDGVDAAQSAPIPDAERTWLQTTVTGPGLLSFWWKVSSEQNHDWLRLLVGGTVERWISGETAWQPCYVAIPPGLQVVQWLYQKDVGGGAVQDACWVDQVRFLPSSAAVPLDAALETPGWTWATGGHADWFGQTNVTHDGTDAAQSGPITDGEDGQFTWMETTVTGPGVLTFWWKVSCERHYDLLGFLVDMELKAVATGEQGWEQRAFTLPAGPVSLLWAYQKDEFGLAGLDAAWVDEVSLITNASVPPTIVRQPASQTVGLDGPAGFGVEVAGGWPLFYQWHFNGAVLSGATNAELVFTNVTAAQAGQYFVVVSNAAGTALSYNVTLATVSLAEVLDTPGWDWSTSEPGGWYGQPYWTHDGVDAAMSGRIGNNQQSWLQTTVTGPGYLTFWWRVESEQDADRLNFYVGGTRLLTDSGLPMWSYESVFIPAGPQVVRWVYAKNHSQSAGLDAGWLDQVAFTPVFVPLADALDTPGRAWTNNGTISWFGQTNTMHDRVDAAQSGVIGDGQQSVLQTTVVGPGLLSFWWRVSSEQNQDFLEFHLGDTVPLRVSGFTLWEQRFVSIPAGEQVVQWVYSKNGSLTGGDDAGWVDEVVFVPATVTLGEALDTPGWNWTTTGAVGWFGQTNRTQDGADAAQSGLLGHGQQSRLQTTVTGPRVLTFWWKASSETYCDTFEFLVNGVSQARLSGEVNWTQRAFSLPAGTVSLEWVFAKDASGSAGQDAAWLDQVRLITDATNPPTLLRQPASQMAARGDRVTLGVEAWGSWPLLYQWHFNGTALAGATNAELTWSHVTASQGGAYFVAVSNAAGSVVSTTATLAVTVPLAEALDTPGRVWSTGGQALWFGQTVTTHDGQSAARTGPIADDEQTELQTTVTGPGYLSFWWKVSSEAQFDRLDFFVNDTRQRSLSGEVEWTNVVLALPEGTHDLKWVYAKDWLESGGQDAGWLDQVAFVPTTATVALDQALDTPGWSWTTTGGASWLGESGLTHDGSDAAQTGAIPDFQHSSLKTTVTGPRILTFWWKTSPEPDYDVLQFLINGELVAQISGEVDWHQRAFTLPPGPVNLEWLFAKDGCDQAGADAGWVDQVRLITDATTAPALLQQPLGQTLEAGTTATFAVEALGSWPLFYQWRRNGVASPGATNATLALTNVTLAQAGEYSLLLSNVAGTLVSSNATLTVGLLLAEALDTPGWLWRTLGDAPCLGQSDLTHDGQDAVRSGPIAHNQTSRLETSVTGPGQVSFWWKVSSDAGDELSFSVGGQRLARVSGAVEWQGQTFPVPEGHQALAWEYAKDSGWTGGQDAGWVDQVTFTPHTVPLAEALDTPGRVWTSDGATTWFGVTNFFHDGADAARSGNISHNQQSRLRTVVNGPAGLAFWWTVWSEAPGDGLQFYVNGVLQAHISGDVPWQSRTFPLGPGQSVLEWTYAKDDRTSEGTDAGWVDQVRLITDTITVPTIVRQPEIQLVEAGRTAVLALEAVGSWPWFYQWHFRGQPLPGETNAALVLTNITPLQAGDYFVVVRNAAGSVTSSVVTVLPLAEAVDAPALEWVSGGDALWLPETDTTHDGLDAARSGPIGGFWMAFEGESWLATWVAGPGQLSFWWKVSTDIGSALQFCVGDEAIAAIYGETDWQQVTVPIPEGEQTLLWSFSRLESYRPDKAGWVDEVRFIADLTRAPALAVQPTNQTVFATQRATFATVATGSRPLSYQWFFNGAALLGATGPTLTLTGVTLAQAGQYALVVSNAAGAVTSAPALLTVWPTVPLAPVLDATNLVCFSTSQAPWHGQTNLSHDGQDAARSGLIGDSEQTRLEATVTGPGLLSFWWKVSSSGYPQQPLDVLRFQINGFAQAQISGEVGWEQKTFAISEGEHLLEWTYAKDEQDAYGQDAGWVDQVVFTPTPGVLAQLAWSAIPSPQPPGQPFAATVTALDAANQPFANFAGPVNLTAWDGPNIRFNWGADFEAPLEGWLSVGTNSTGQLSKEAAAQGSYSLKLTTPFVASDPLHPDEERLIWNPFGDQPDGRLLRPLDQLRPERISFHIRTDWKAWCGYFVAGNGPALHDAAVFFCLADISAGGAAGSLGAMGLYDGETFHKAQCLRDRWYKVLLHLDWAHRTVDLYVDDQLVAARVSFRNPDADRLTLLTLYNLRSAQVWYDDIQFTQNDRAQPLPLTPALASEFVNGVWTGAITLPLAAPTVVLRADDGHGHVGVSQPFAVGSLELPRFLSPPRFVPQGVELNLTAPAGRAVLIETSPDLATWTPLITLPNPSGVVQHTDAAAHLQQRFYRASLPASP